MRKGCGVVVRSPLFDEFQVLVELEQLRGRAAAGAAPLAGARIYEQMAFRIHGNAFRFADRVPRDLKREMFFGYLQLRSLCLQVELLLSGGLRLRSVGTKALATDTQRRLNDQNAEYQGTRNNVAIHTENLLCEKCGLQCKESRSGTPQLRSFWKCMTWGSLVLPIVLPKRVNANAPEFDSVRPLMLGKLLPNSQNSISGRVAGISD